MDARFLFLGLLANIAGVLSLFAWSTIQYAVILVLLSAGVVSASLLTCVGLLKRGFISADAVGGILLANSPIWLFGVSFLWGSIEDYNESLSFCEDYKFGVSSALPRCEQAQAYLYMIWLLSASLSISAIVGVVSLLHLRKLSEKD